MFCSKLLHMAAIITEIKFVFHFGIGRIRSLAKWSVHSLWLSFSFQFWSKGPWKCICSIITNDKKEVDGEGGTERRCSLLSLHTFKSLAPTCSSKLCSLGLMYRRALPFPFGISLWCFPPQSWGLRSHSPVVEAIFVPC